MRVFIIIMVCYDQGKRQQASGTLGDGSKQDILPRTAQVTAALTKLKPIWRDYNKLVLFCETL